MYILENYQSILSPSLSAINPVFISGYKDIEAWSERKNSPAKVNSWKTGLTSSELKMIESDCGETLSKMEYQLLGTVL